MIDNQFYRPVLVPDSVRQWGGAILPPTTSAAGDALPASDISLRHRHDGWTPVKQRRFLEALEETACVRAAASLVGMSDTGAYRLRKASARFRAAWETALARGTVNLERIAYDRVVKGSERVRTRDGKELWRERVQSDRLLLTLLQARKPEVYGTNGAGTAGRDARTGRFAAAAAKIPWADDDGLVGITVRVSPEEAEWYTSDEYARMVDTPEYRDWRTLSPVARERALVADIEARLASIEAEEAGRAHPTR